MLWWVLGLLVVGLLAPPVWSMVQGWRLASQDDGLYLLALQHQAAPDEQRLEWLGEALSRERQAEAKKERIAFLELMTADALVRADRKQDALVLYARHLPGGGLWEKFLNRRAVLTKWSLVAWQRGDYTTAQVAIDAALECEPQNPTVLRVKGLVVKKLTADLAATSGWFERSLVTTEEEKKALQTLKTTAYLAGLRADLGDLEGAEKDVEAALARFRVAAATVSEGERIEVGGVGLQLVTLQCRLGRVGDARRCFDANDLPRPDRSIEMEYLAVKLELEAAEGASAPEAELTALVEEAARRKDHDGFAKYSVALAHVAARAGRNDEARAALVTARDSYEKSKSKSDLAHVEHTARRLSLTL